MTARIKRPRRPSGPHFTRSSTPLRPDRVGVFESLSVPEPNSGCLLWIGSTNRKGYGQFNTGYTTAAAHRIAYERAFGPIPEGLCVCHRCDTPACVNPDHFFVGTIEDNNKDMARKGRAKGPSPDKRRLKIVCKRGHPRVGDNVRIVVTGDGKIVRLCRACEALKAANEHAAAEARKAARRAAMPVTAPRVCVLGHLVAGDNVYVDKDGCRRCATCRRAYFRAKYLAKKAQKGLHFPAINAPASGDSAGFEAHL